MYYTCFHKPTSQQTLAPWQKRNHQSAGAHPSKKGKGGSRSGHKVAPGTWELSLDNNRPSLAKMTPRKEQRHRSGCGPTQTLTPVCHKLTVRKGEFKGRVPRQGRSWWSEMGIEIQLSEKGWGIEEIKPSPKVAGQWHVRPGPVKSSTENQFGGSGDVSVRGGLAMPFGSTCSSLVPQDNRDRPLEGIRHGNSFGSAFPWAPFSETPAPDTHRGKIRRIVCRLRGQLHDGWRSERSDSRNEKQGKN